MQDHLQQQMTDISDMASLARPSGWKNTLRSYLQTSWPISMSMLPAPGSISKLPHLHSCLMSCVMSRGLFRLCIILLPTQKHSFRKRCTTTGTVTSVRWDLDRIIQPSKMPWELRVSTWGSRAAKRHRVSTTTIASTIVTIG